MCLVSFITYLLCNCFYVVNYLIGCIVCDGLTVQHATQFWNSIAIISARRQDGVQRTPTPHPAGKLHGKWPAAYMARISFGYFNPAIFLFFVLISQRHPLDYEGSAGLRWGDPRPNAQAQPLTSWASRRPPLSCQVHGRDPHHDCSMSSRWTLAILSRDQMLISFKRMSNLLFFVVVL